VTDELIPPPVGTCRFQTSAPVSAFIAKIQPSFDPA